jgi:hypothetical protein
VTRLGRERRRAKKGLEILDVQGKFDAANEAFGQWHCGSPAGCNGNSIGYLVNLD